MLKIRRQQTTKKDERYANIKNNKLFIILLL